MNMFSFDVSMHIYVSGICEDSLWKSVFNCRHISSDMCSFFLLTANAFFEILGGRIGFLFSKTQYMFHDTGHVVGTIAWFNV